MGFITGLLTLPLAPVRGVAWVTEKITEELERQLYDEDAIRSELMALELAYEDGTIGEDERNEREDALLELLALSQEREDG